MSHEGQTTAFQNRGARRARAHAATRAAILEAARRVAAKQGARNLSLRGVAGEAGFAPAALYGYFRSKDDLLLALAAEDLASIARSIRDAMHAGREEKGFAAAAHIVFERLQTMETIAAAQGALAASRSQGEAERLFNGRLIGALTALSEAGGRRAETREQQADVLLVAASLAGLALFARSGRLAALGFSADELLRRLDLAFAPRP